MAIRLHLMSDLHCEFHVDKGDSFVEALKPEGIDVLLLAGDIGRLSNMEAYDRFLGGIVDKYKNSKIFIVPGNHEAYSLVSYQAELRMDDLVSKFPSVTRLRAGVLVEHLGHRFIGDTMWFPDQPDNNRYADFIYDFSLIKKFVPWVYRQNTAWREFVQKEMKQGDIVLTHHLPTSECIHPRFKKAPDCALNRFFLSDMTKEIQDKKPALWAFGHTHEPIDYMEGKTRVVCNPLGYPRERVTPYTPQLIEIP